MLSSFLPAPARADSRSQRLLIIKSLFKKERKERETESARHQRRAERLLDYQRNSQKIRPWDEGGEKEGRKRTGGTERGRERESMNANQHPNTEQRLYPSQAEEHQSQTHFLKPRP